MPQRWTTRPCDRQAWMVWSPVLRMVNWRGRRWPPVTVAAAGLIVSSKGFLVAAAGCPTAPEAAVCAEFRFPEAQAQQSARGTKYAVFSNFIADLEATYALLELPFTPVPYNSHDIQQGPCQIRAAGI